MTGWFWSISLTYGWKFPLSVVVKIVVLKNTPKGYKSDLVHFLPKKGVKV